MDFLDLAWLKKVLDIVRRFAYNGTSKGEISVHSVTKVEEIIEVGMTDALLAYLMIIEESEETAHWKIRHSISELHSLVMLLGGRNAK